MALSQKVVIGVTLSVAVIALLCLFFVSRSDRNLVTISDVGLRSSLPAPGKVTTGRLIHKPNVSSVLSRYAAKIFSKPDTDPENEKFTIVMTTYKRNEILQKVLNHHCKTPQLDKIIVIWNNVGTPVPGFLLNISNSCAVPLKFIEETENKLTRRFKPRPEIETDCVAIMDDDRFITELADFVFGFRVWQQFRQRIVGYEHRMHVKQADGKYHYGPDWLHGGTPVKFGYSLMGAGTALMHRAYLEMYHDPEILPKGMIKYINQVRNCEDIGMNVMVTKFLEDISWPQCSALSVVAHGKIKNLQAEAHEGFRGLSMRPQHYIQRSKCLNKFKEFYNGHLPLHYTHARVTYEPPLT